MTTLITIIVFQDVNRGTLQVEIEDIRKWKDRILEAIDTGFIITVRFSLTLCEIQRSNVSSAKHRKTGTSFL